MKQEKKKIIISLIVGVILSLVIEAILVMSEENFFSIDRVLVLIALLFVIIIHIVINKNKLYDFIIENRFKIALVVFLVTCTLGYSIVSFSEESLILGEFNEFSNLKYLEFKEYFNIANENLSQMLYLIFTNFRVIALILISYELCFIISKENKYMAVIGGVVIAFSSYMMMHLNTVIIFGEMVIVFAYKSLVEQNNLKQGLFYCLLVISMICFGFQLDLSSIIAFGYVIIAFIISFILMFKKDKKIDKKQIISLVCIMLALTIIIVIYHAYMVNIGKEILYNSSDEENKLNKVFGYGISVIETFKPIENSEDWTSFITIFPVPILISLIYMYKKEKEFEFLFPISVVLVLDVICAAMGISGIIGNITGLSLVTKDIAAVMVSIMNIYLMVYIVSNLKERAIGFVPSIYISLVIIIVYYFVSKPAVLATQNVYYFFVMIMIVPSLLLLNYVDKRYKKVFCFFVVFLTILSSITINPITKANYMDFTKYNEKNFFYINDVNVNK